MLCGGYFLKNVTDMWWRVKDFLIVAGMTRRDNGEQRDPGPGGLPVMSPQQYQKLAGRMEQSEKACRVK